MAKICTVGSATQDIFISADFSQTMQITLAGDYPRQRSFLLFEKGRKIDVPALHFAVGGGATNAAITFKRFGHESFAFFNTADDDTGKMIRDSLEKEGINLLNPTIINQKSRTGRSYIFVTQDANHVAFSHRGVNRLMKCEAFPLDIIPTLDYIHFSSLSGQSKQLMPYICEQAKKWNAQIVCNPGLGQLSYNPDEFIELLSSINILQVNAFEGRTLFEAILNYESKVENCSSQETTSESPHFSTHDAPPPLLQFFMDTDGVKFSLFDYCAKLFSYGPEILVLTDGGRGVYVATRETIYFHPPLPAKIVSGLGAGDAFGSGFISALAFKRNIESAIMYGVLNATAVLESMDAQSGILSHEEVEKRAQKLGTKFIEKYSIR